MIRVFPFALFCALLAALNFYVYSAVLSRGELTLRVLDVGEGHALLLTTPGGAEYLIDTGPDASILRALGETLPEWRRTLAGVIETSPANAASGGFSFFSSRYRAEMVAEPRDLVRGTRIDLGSGVSARVLYPDRSLSAPSDAERAAMLRIDYGATSFLLEETTAEPSIDWVSVLDKRDGALASSVTIASSTPPGVYRSDGREVRTK